MQEEQEKQELAEQTSENDDFAAPQIFYARRISGIGIGLSCLALLALGWTLTQGYALTLGSIIGFVFFTVILVVNIVMYMRPYVTIGNDYVQVFKRRAAFNQIVKYEDFAKGFVICFNALPGQPKYQYDERLLVSYSMLKTEDKTKIEYALRAVVLKALETKNQNKKKP